MVILRGCDFFDLFAFSAYSSPPDKIVILSGAQIYRVTRRLWRGAEGTPAVLNLPNAARSFSTTEADNRICCDTHLMVRRTSFHAR
jgi:hypothetical protein